jgi:ribonuclease J
MPTPQTSGNRPYRPARRYARPVTRPANGAATPTHERTGGRPAEGVRRAGGGSRPRGRAQARRPRGGANPPLQHRNTVADPDTPIIPPMTDTDTVRVIPVGGVEEVGKNMLLVETADDIIIFDAGFQFVSEENDAPGINYILPNTQYLEQNKDKIRALVITHGHLDHIGGIPFLMERLGNPPIYTRYLTSLMILKRQEEFPHLPKVDLQIVEPWQRIKLGNTYIKPFPVTHSIPDSMGISVETKYGNIVISGDLKLEHEDGVPTKAEQEVWGTIGKDNNILFIADSTNAEKTGFSIPELRVHSNIEEIIRSVKGRLIIGTFASQFARMTHIIAICEKLGKKVITEGRSIKTNIEIAQKAGILTVQKDTIIPVQEIDNYPADRIVVISTGAQGEEFAALMRIATKQHKFITLGERDTIMLSSSVIPGNELSVQKLKDNLYRRGAQIIHYRSSDVHSTGHGNSGELVWMNQQVRARFFMPAYGYHSMIRCHAYAVEEAGFPKENVILADNGSIVDIKNGTELNVHKEKAPTEIMMVDGFTVGMRQEVVIRDRQSLAQDGMFVIIATLNIKTGKLRKSPDIISRGFVYLRESQQLLSEARMLIKRTVEKSTEHMHPINLDFVKDQLTDTVTGFLLQKTNKTPMVIPVLIGI